MLIKQRQLQAPAVDQVSDRQTLQRRDPAQPRMLLQGVDLSLGEQTAIPDQHDARKPKPLPQFLNLIRDCGRIARVAGIDIDRHRSSTRVGQYAIDNDGQAFLAVAVVAIEGQGTGAPFIVAAADVIEDPSCFAQVKLG